MYMANISFLLCKKKWELHMVISKDSRHVHLICFLVLFYATSSLCLCSVSIWNQYMHTQLLPRINKHKQLRRQGKLERESFFREEEKGCSVVQKFAS